MSTALENRWNPADAAGLDEPGLLLYRSNLLGSDKRITNFGGGNTSLKTVMADPLTGDQADVLWVKGSGGDLGSMTLDGFATLYQDKLDRLKALYRGIAHEDEMVGYLPHCTFNLNPRAASIDTPLHAYLPVKHVDHMHPDSVIAIAAAKDSERLTNELYGDEIGWLPWQRPGFDLGLKLEAKLRDNPGYRGLVLGGHGLFTWADDPRECYELTLAIIQKAQDWLDGHRVKPAFGGAKRTEATPDARASQATSLMPKIRGLISGQEPKTGHFDDSEAVLEFVNSNDLQKLAALGTSCPDHFLRTKIRPIVIEPGIRDAELEASLEQYRGDYAQYYARCRHDDSPAMRDSNPVVYLIPGCGMITFAKDKTTARIAGEFYINAINVMAGAERVSSYVGLSEQEAFNIEYWLLEEAKLQRMPKPKSLAGRIALITGAAGGIGQAVAVRLLGEGACVMLTDRDRQPLSTVADAMRAAFGGDRVHDVLADVTDERDMVALLDVCARRFGGIDIMVANAGLASAAPFDETSVDDWERNAAVLGKGVFLACREAFKTMKRQGIGGSIITICSKNALAASSGASAYCSAKASALHLTRCMALEGGPHRIRANIVNPDAVLRGSRIWQGQWLHARMESHGVDRRGLDEVYRKRSLLKRSVYPEDIAEAVYFWASDVSAKSTGNIINVDAGNATAFSR